jgi:CheY-like chemotaxis protein
LNRSLEERVATRTVEVRHLAEQLRALASQLADAEQRERKRLATILHDHIQQLIVAAQLQVSRLPKATHPSQLDAAAQSIGEVLREALDASRSLAVELSPPVLHESGLIAGLNWLATRMGERHGLHVRLRAEAAAEPADDEVPVLLFECARELLLNVTKHAGVERAEVSLMRPAAGEVRLVVSDGGSGFEPDALKGLRPDQMTFGLFSIQQRLAHVGGRLEVESAPAMGTKVTLVVPVPEAPELAPPVLATRGAHDTRGIELRSRRKRCRVLIVDDHQIVREGLAGLLQIEPNIEIVGEAANGEEAIARAGELRPDIIVMDINLGAGIDGIEATRRVLATTPGIKVIGLSMHADQDVTAAMLDAGAAAYVTKGGPPEDLIAAIRTHYTQ